MSEGSEESEEISASPIGELQELKRKVSFYEDLLTRRGVLTEDGKVIVDIPAPAGFGRMGATATRIVDLEPEDLEETNARYVHIINSMGEVEGALRKDVEKQVEWAIESVSRLAEKASNTAGKIANKVGGPSFELDEISVGLTITAAAGVVLASFGGDTNLELKFV